MSLSEIKVVERNGIKQVFIDGIKQKSVSEVSTYVLPGEITEVHVVFATEKFEIIREEE